MGKASVLVTGGCGFIGSEVVRVLLEQGFRVRVVDNLSKQAGGSPAGAEFIEADLAEGRTARKLFEGFTYCIHLAARIGGIGYFHKFPATIVSENNKIGSTVFEAATENRLRQIVYVSSSMVFESATRFPSKEEDVDRIPPPRSAYGFSKLTGERFCRAFWDEFRLPFTILRPFNAFGPNELPEDEPGAAHVIPDLIKKLLEGQDPVEILGDGNQTRCFTHVRDIAEAFPLVLGNDKAKNEDFNIGSERETSISELARLLHGMIRPGRPFRVRHLPAFEHDTRRRVPDVSKAKRILGWEGRIRLEDGLPPLIDWLRKQHTSKASS